MRLTSEKKERIIEWENWLRANPDKQGVGSLRPSENRFCCLGVACEISQLSRWGIEPREFGHSPGPRFYMGKNNILPAPVMEYYGLPFNQGFEFLIWLGVDSREMQATYLTDLNDSGFTFSQIADIITYWREAH